jgi:hypothetical protein
MVTRNNQRTWYGRQHEQTVEPYLTIILINMDTDSVFRVVPTAGQSSNLEVIMSYFGAVHAESPENTDWLGGCTLRRYVGSSLSATSACLLKPQTFV